MHGGQRRCGAEKSGNSFIHGVFPTVLRAARSEAAASRN
jgi:hypothetical protein